MIAVGSTVTWNPEDITKILPEEMAEAFGARLPLPGIVARLDGGIGLMRYQKRSGQTGTMPVKVEELREVRLW